MRHTKPFGFAAIGVVVFSMRCALAADVRPCIDTNPTTRLVSRTMKVQVTGKPDVVRVGSVRSIDAATGDVRFAFTGMTEEVAARPSAIVLDVPPPHVMAQMKLPVFQSLGKVHARYAMRDVLVDNGTLRYPSCTPPSPNHEITFVGVIRFDAASIDIDGEFFDIYFEAGGGFVPGGTQKPGS